MTVIDFAAPIDCSFPTVPAERITSPVFAAVPLAASRVRPRKPRSTIFLLTLKSSTYATLVVAFSEVRDSERAGAATGGF
ncbi:MULTISPECIES: hypothetical protein [Mycobacterium]|uniref:hypothetical protein n=1 Tax=Mycobacterium TaxID=1763 RepID=UPI001EF042AC|nr:MULTISPECIES: hypothetical protein [Mycobacterium]